MSDVRDVVRVSYTEAVRDTRPWWLRLWHRITGYPWSPPICTREEAQAIADAALRDLSDPPMTDHT